MSLTFNPEMMKDSSDSEDSSDISSEVTSSPVTREENAVKMELLKIELAKNIEEEEKCQAFVDEHRNKQAKLAQRISELQVSKVMVNNSEVADVIDNKELVKLKVEEDKENKFSNSSESVNKESEEDESKEDDDSKELHFFDRPDLVLTEDNIAEELEKILADKPDVNKLDLDMTKLNTESLEKVITFLKRYEGITDLSLSDAGLSLTEIKLLADFLENSRINKLVLNQNNFTLESVEYLMSSLSSDNCQLISLSLSINKLRENSIITIMNYLPKTQITNLDLGANQITNEIVSNFTDTIKDLKTLDLSCNYINDKAVPSLINLLDNSKIELLDLEFSQLSDDGCKIFEDMGLSGRMNLENSLEGFY